MIRFSRAAVLGTRPSGDERKVAIAMSLEDTYEQKILRWDLSSLTWIHLEGERHRANLHSQRNGWIRYFRP